MRVRARATIETSRSPTSGGAEDLHPDVVVARIKGRSALLELPGLGGIAQRREEKAEPGRLLDVLVYAERSVKSERGQINGWVDWKNIRGFFLSKMKGTSRRGLTRRQGGLDEYSLRVGGSVRVCCRSGWACRRDPANSWRRTIP